MENWNWQQTLGSALMTAAVIMGCIGGIIFVFSFLKPMEALVTLLALLLVIGFTFWKYGSKKNKTSVNSKN